VEGKKQKSGGAEMGKIFTPPTLTTLHNKKSKTSSEIGLETEAALWSRVTKNAPDPAMTPDAALAAWMEDENAGLPWVAAKHAKQFAASCAAHGIQFTRDDMTQGGWKEWKQWASK
jgi:hypothetical protein